MYAAHSNRCNDRIVSISQPYVRPIVRGKLNKPVEFGAKLSLSGDGIAQVDHLRWDAFNEGGDLASQVERIATAMVTTRGGLGRYHLRDTRQPRVSQTTRDSLCRQATGSPENNRDRQ